MEIAVCVHDDNEWGSLTEKIHSYQSFVKKDVIIKKYSSKEAYAKNYAMQKLDIMICCFGGNEGLETIALAKRHNFDIRLIWIGDNKTFSPSGYRIRGVEYIEKPHVEEQLKAALFGKQKVVQYPVVKKAKNS
jgi:chlorite dismutase